MLPELLDINTEWRPSHDTDMLLLYIDNNPHSLANVLQHVRGTLELFEKEAAVRLRSHIYSDYRGPTFAAKRYGDDNTEMYMKSRLQKLLDTKTRYYKSYLYWIDILRHYRTKHNEGCRLEEYLPEAIDKVKEQKRKEAMAIAARGTIPDEIKEILNNCTIDDDALTVTLPEGQLAPKVYAAFKKVLLGYDGKWKSNLGTHVFPNRQAIDLLREGIKTGKAINIQQTKQSFYTPPEIVDLMMKEAQVRKYHLCLEPSAGDGRIAKRLKDLGCDVHCVELDKHDADALVEKSYAVWQQDFLTFNSPSLVTQYDRIVMNPPFTKMQDIKHILHAWKMLKPGGRLVSIASGSVQFRGTALHNELVELIKKNGKIKELPVAAFKESGTTIKTVMVILNKGK